MNRGGHVSLAGAYPLEYSALVFALAALCVAGFLLNNYSTGSWVEVPDST